MVDFDFKPGTFVRVSFKHTKMIAHSIFKEIKGEEVYTYIDFIDNPNSVYEGDINLLTYKDRISDIQEINELEKDAVLLVFRDKGYYWNPISLKVSKSKFPDGTIVTDDIFAYVYGGSKYEYTLAVDLKTLEIHKAEDLGYVNSDVFEKTSEEVAKIIYNIINNVYSEENLHLVKILLDKKLKNNEEIIPDMKNNIFIDEAIEDYKIKPIEDRNVYIHDEFRNFIKRIKRDMINPCPPIKIHDIETSSLVLVRNSNKEAWIKKFFLRRDDSGINVTTDGGCYKFCIKFIGNEKLLNTI